MTRTRQQLGHDRDRLQNDAGFGGRRDIAAKIVALATHGLKASQEELQDALSAAATLNPLQRRILKLFLERLTLPETQIDIYVFPPPARNRTYAA